jgi:hypothetical protein
LENQHQPQKELPQEQRTSAAELQEPALPAPCDHKVTVPELQGSGPMTSPTPSAKECICCCRNEVTAEAEEITATDEEGWLASCLTVEAEATQPTNQAQPRGQRP